MSNLQLCNILEDSAYALLDNCFNSKLDAPMFGDENINSCMTMSNEIEKVRLQTKIGVTSGRVASVVGGGLSIGGAMLLPFTFGSSVGLIAAGAALGVTGGAVSVGFSLHKFVRDRQKSKTLPTCAMKFIKIRDKLAKIAVAINSVLVHVKVLRNSKMWGKVQIKSNDSSVDTLIQLRKEIGNGCITSNPDAAINDVLDKTARVLKAFEDIIEESNITDVQLHPRMKKDIEPSSETLDIALQNLKKGGFREGMNIGKLLLAFFTEQFDDLYKGADLNKIKMAAYPKIARAVNGSSGYVIRPMSVNMAHATGGGTASYGILQCKRMSVAVASAGASTERDAAIKLFRGIPIVGILFASLGIVSESFNLISQRMDLSKTSKDKREDLSKQFYELAVIMALTNTIVSSPGW